MEEKKKRGRPRKEESPQETEVVTSEESDEAAEKSPEDNNGEDALNGRYTEQVNQNQEKQEQKPIIPLSDPEPYPSEAEKTFLENETVHPDIRIPETNDDRKFLRKTFKKNKMKKDMMVCVHLLHQQGDVTVHYLPCDERGGFTIGDGIYNVNEHCLYNLKVKRRRYPICYLPVWTMVPIGTKAWFELSQERRGEELLQIIISKIQHEEVVKADEGIKKKSAFSGKMLMIILLVLVGGYFILKSMGKI